MECMKRLAEQGRIVISSIHQPRAAIWDLFTKVQVLSEGRSLYFGPSHQVRRIPTAYWNIPVTILCFEYLCMRGPLSLLRPHPPGAAHQVRTPIFPDWVVTTKLAEVRMGRRKCSPSHCVC